MFAIEKSKGDSFRLHFDLLYRARLSGHKSVVTNTHVTKLLVFASAVFVIKPWPYLLTIGYIYGGYPNPSDCRKSGTSETP